MMILRKFFILMIMCGLAMALSSCGPSQKIDSSGYYGVGWTSDQKIITAYRHSQIEGKDNSENVFADHWLAIIDPATFNEEKIINIPWGEGPGYFFGDLGSFFGFVGAINSAQNNLLKKYVLPDQILEAQIPDRSLSTSVLLSPSKSLLVYNNLDRFRIYNTNFDLIKEKIAASYSVWKNDQELFFYDHPSDKLALYNMTEDSISLFPLSFKPDFFDPTQNLLYRVKDGVFYQYDLSRETITSRNLSYDFLQLDEHFFSPDGKKLLLSRGRGFYLPSKSLKLHDSLGIYLYDLETDVLTKVRD